MTEGKENQKQAGFEEKTFPVPFGLREITENITIVKNIPSKPSKEKIIIQALKFHTEGNILEAEKYYQYFINQGFNDHMVFSNYGAILRDLGKLKEAEFSNRKAIKLKPDYAIAHYNLGNILNDLGKLKEAESSLRKAIELNPNFAEANYNLGLILKNLGNLKEAELSTRKAIELNPNFAAAYSNLGGILNDLGNLQDAELSYRKAIKLNPNFAEAYSNLGNVLRDLDNLEEAELSTRKAIKLNPNFAAAYNNLANVLIDLNNLQGAELSTRKAIEIKPDFALAHSNLGYILSNLGQLQEAELSTRKAIELKPDFADAYFNLSYIELIKGNYQCGLENYEFRFKKKQPVIPHANPNIQIFNTKKLVKGEKLLVVSEQGLGDTLQFMRYVPYLKNQGLDISFCALETLHALIQASGIDPNPLTPEQANKVSDGRWIRLLSLPKYLKVSPENPIVSNPYIYSTNEFKQKWKKILSKEKRPIVGINWQGNPNAEKRGLRGRSLPLETFSTLARNKNLKFLSLQKGFGLEQLDHCSFKDKFVESQSQINSTWNFLEIAGIIENCDLIITSDTSIAHLAGGIGKQTWLLLKYVPGWIWGLQGENTFWYPSMTLFRQKEKENWNEVINRVDFELNSFFKSKRLSIMN